MLGVDYSFARPDPATIQALGYGFVVRYISPPPNGKNLTPDERDGILGAGLGLVLVWETYEQAASRTGYAGGQAEGARAIQMAQDLGYPAGRTIYFVLEDPRRIASNLYPAAAQYAQGVKDLGGPYVVGGYGSQDLMEYALGQGAIDMGWQVEGWSHAVSGACHLYQRSNGRQIDLDGTDEDVALQPEFGAWWANASTGNPVPDPAPEPNPTPVPEEDDVQTVIILKERKGVAADGSNVWYTEAEDKVKSEAVYASTDGGLTCVWLDSYAEAMERFQMWTVYFKDQYKVLGTVTEPCGFTDLPVVVGPTPTLP